MTQAHAKEQMLSLKKCYARVDIDVFFADIFTIAQCRTPELVISGEYKGGALF